MASLIPTRGPWEVQYTESDQTLRIIGAPVTRGDRQVIAVVVGNDITAEANAALLGAALNLLLTLKRARIAIQAYSDGGAVAEHNARCILNQMDAAIRKAEVREDA